MQIAVIIHGIIVLEESGKVKCFSIDKPDSINIRNTGTSNARMNSKATLKPGDSISLGSQKDGIPFISDLHFQFTSVGNNRIEIIMLKTVNC